MSETKPDVSINIVNWNGGAYIDKCLESIFVQDYDGEKEVILVDNGSTDHSLDVIKRKFPQVRIIRNDSNLGFCKAHNQAIRMSEGRYILVLNFDIILEKYFLSEMIKAMEKNDRIGIVSGKLYKMVGNGKTRLLDSTGIEMKYFFSSPRGEMKEDSGQYDAPDKRVIFGACGAACLYRRKMLEDVRYKKEYFDEDFVNYIEDVDLSWRARLRGWKAVYEPQAIAYHERGVTRNCDKKEQLDYYLRGYRNRYLAIYKNVDKHEFWKVLHKFIAVELFFIISGRNDSVKPQVKFKALKDAFKARNMFKEKREYIQKGVLANPKEIMSFFSYDRFNTISFISNKVKNILTEFLCGFHLGRALLRRLKAFKREYLKG